MKSIIFTLVAFLCISCLACNQKKAQSSKDQKSEETTDPKPGDDVSGDEQSPKPYQVAGFRKTACFGKCPVYEVKFFSDNTATWNGKMHVERMGQFTAKLESGTLKSIKDKANEVGYIELYNQYPIEHKVADLPTTITYLRIGDMEKIIKNTHDAPAQLTEYEAYLEGIINSLDWQAAKE